MAKLHIDTEPCDTCDYAPCFCGRDIEDCMVNPEVKIFDQSPFGEDEIDDSVQLSITGELN